MASAVPRNRALHERNMPETFAKGQFFELQVLGQWVGANIKEVEQDVNGYISICADITYLSSSTSSSSTSSSLIEERIEILKRATVSLAKYVVQKPFLIGDQLWVSNETHTTLCSVSWDNPHYLALESFDKSSGISYGTRILWSRCIRNRGARNCDTEKYEKIENLIKEDNSRLLRIALSMEANILPPPSSSAPEISQTETVEDASQTETVEDADAQFSHLTLTVPVLQLPPPPPPPPSPLLSLPSLPPLSLPPPSLPAPEISQTETVEDADAQFSHITPTFPALSLPPPSLPPLSLPLPSLPALSLPLPSLPALSLPPPSLPPPSLPPFFHASQQGNQQKFAQVIA